MKQIAIVVAVVSGILLLAVSAVQNVNADSKASQHYWMVVLAQLCQAVILQNIYKVMQMERGTAMNNSSNVTLRRKHNSKL